MRIGIIGPTEVNKRCRLLGLDWEFFYSSLHKVLDLVKDHELVLVPHKGSTSYWVAKEFSGRVIGIIPLDDREFGVDYLDKEVCNEIINAKTWRNVPEVLDETSDVLLVFGLGCGELVEICQTKWFKVEKIIIVEDFISQRLHKEAEENLNVSYISMAEIDKLSDLLGD